MSPMPGRARAAEVPAEQRQILDDLAEARLVVVTEVQEHTAYAPAHEALFRSWPPLVNLIEHRRDDLRFRGRLERRAADWACASGGSSSGLLSGLEIAQAEEWRDRNAHLLTPDIAAHIDSSHRQRRRMRVVRACVGALVAGLIITLVAVLLVNAQRDRHRAVELLASIADSELEHDPGRRGDCTP